MGKFKPSISFRCNYLPFAVIASSFEYNTVVNFK